MSKGFRNVIGLTAAYLKTMKVRPGDKCPLCGEKATHKVETIYGGQGACEKHARMCVERGYRVEPEILHTQAAQKKVEGE